MFQEHLHHLDEIEGCMKRFEAAIHMEAFESEKASVIQALQMLRGAAEVIATSLVAVLKSGFSKAPQSHEVWECKSKACT